MFNIKKWPIAYFRFTRSEHPELASTLIAVAHRLDNHPTFHHTTILTINVENLVEWADRTNSWDSNLAELQELFTLIGDNPDIQQLMVNMDHPDQHNYRCNCIEQVNELLAKSNTELDTTINLAPEKNGLPVQMAKVVTMKLDSRQRGRAMSLTGSYCPFCGKVYKVEEASE